MKSFENDTNDVKADGTQNDGRQPHLPALGRRDLMKLGAGLAVMPLSALRASAQSATPQPAVPSRRQGPAIRTARIGLRGTGPWMTRPARLSNG